MKKKSYKVFKIIGIIAAVVIIAFLIIIFSQKNSSSDKKTDNLTQYSECNAINLKISETNTNTNILSITRLTGTGDLYKIKLFVNGNPVYNLIASNIKEGDKKIFIVNMNPGDKIEIAPILRDGTICAVGDTKIA